MDIQKYIKNTLCTLTESMLLDRIRLAKTIEEYQRDEFPLEQKDLFDTYVQMIISERLNRYDFREEDVKRIFRFSSIAKSVLYLNLLYFEAGRCMAVGDDNPTLKKLNTLWDSMDYGFFLSYSLDENDLLKILKQVSAPRVLKETRSCAGYRNEVYELCEKEIKPGMSDADIIKLISPYNDGAYVELPDYVSLLSYLLIRDEKYDLWVRLLVKLKYFPLQGGIVCDIRTLDDFIGIFQVLNQTKVPHRNVLLYLLRERYFHLISEQPRNLNRSYVFLKDNNMKKHAEYCERYLEEFLGIIEAKTLDTFTYFVNQLGLSECSEWYSRKYNQYDDRDERFVAYEKKAVRLIGNVIENLSKPIRWNLTTADIKTLFFYIKQTKTKQVTPLRCKLLINALYQRLFFEDNYYQLAINEETFDLLRCSYQCLIYSGVDAIQMLLSLNYTAEGYNSDFQAAARIRKGDSFWLSMLLLGAGEQEDEDLFHRYLCLLLDRVRCQSQDSREYTMPLYVAELVVTQVLQTEKNRFESYLISNLPHLDMVLITLLPNKGTMEQSVKDLLLQRIDAEWQIESKILRRQHDMNLKVIEEYISQL